MTRLATAVVGAGPAGLLFCLVGRILYPGADWDLALYDKRAEYARTHRLRIAPAPYLAIQRDLQDPRFDALIAFLEAADFSPAVNRLEAHLSEALASVGVVRQVLEARSLADIPLAGDRRTIVGADSVHSTVRGLLGGATAGATHQTVARLRITGPGLPAALGVVDRYRLSKLLGSILDYRLNPNGWAEVDLFLGAREHAAAGGLGARPAEPVVLTAHTLDRVRAPLLRRIVEHLGRGFGAGPCEVALTSTFRLEHAVAPRRSWARPDADVFLVGDAAVSLPFFRGMACLAQCAHALARVHADLLAELPARDTTILAPDRPLVIGGRPLPGRILAVAPTTWHGAPADVVLHRWLWRYGVHILRRTETGHESAYRLAWIGQRAATADFRDRADPVRRYDAEVATIVRSELAIVRARGRLLGGVREFVRVSALLPFPIQDWFLTVPDAEPTRLSITPGLAMNAGIALGAAGLALGGFALPALAVQALGGVVYHAALVFEAGPRRLVRRVWELQIAGLMLAGGVGAASGRPWLALAWLGMSATFVAGLYAFDGLAGRWYRSAELE